MVALERGDDACMRCTFLRWGKKKEEEKTAFRWYMVPKRVVEVPFFLSSFSFLAFGFWFLVFYCRVTRVARGVFLFFFVSIGLGWVGVHYTTWGESFALDWTTGTCYLFLIIDEMAGEGMERGGWLV